MQLVRFMTAVHSFASVFRYRIRSMCIMKMNFRLFRQAAALCVFALVGTGCSLHPSKHVAERPPTFPQSRDAQTNMSVGARAADIAMQQVGAPYRWGGDTPQGFDCSGLVHYSYAQVGFAVPRTTREQRRALRPVDIATAEPGDLLFFKTSRKDWHVALYLGHNEFVHAPSTGKMVTVGSLNNSYYRDHLVDVRQAVSR
jgi:cell wall-associated NlpC family hydrolase